MQMRHSLTLTCVDVCENVLRGAQVSQRSAQMRLQAPQNGPQNEPTDPKMTQIGRSAAIMGPQAGTWASKTALESSQGRHGVRPRGAMKAPRGFFANLGVPKGSRKRRKWVPKTGRFWDLFFLTFLTSIWSVLGGPNGSKLGSFDDARGNA